MELKRWTKGTDDSLRCDFILTDGRQCCNMAEPTSSGEPCGRCALHGANKILASKERQSLRLYNLAKFQERADQLTDHDKIKGLREELALLRMLVEARVTQCTDMHDLLLQSGPLSDLIMKVEKVVTSCNRLENSLGDMLDKQRIKNLASSFMQLVATKINEFAEVHAVEDEDVQTLLEAIANGFISLVFEKQ